MQLFNVVSKKEYSDKEGNKKVKFFNVGIMKITDAGKRYLQLFHLPQTEFYIFERDKNQPESQTEE